MPALGKGSIGFSKGLLLRQGLIEAVRRRQLELEAAYPPPPPLKRGKHVRAELFVQIHVVRPIADDPSGSRLTVVTQLDPKGNVPSWMQDFEFGASSAKTFSQKTRGLVVAGVPFMAEGEEVRESGVGGGGGGGGGGGAAALVGQQQRQLSSAPGLGMANGMMSNNANLTPMQMQQELLRKRKAQQQQRLQQQREEERQRQLQEQQQQQQQQQQQERKRAPGLADFDLLSVLGRGGYGKVLQVRHKRTRKVYAMKVISKASLSRQHQRDRLRVERSVLAQIRHPYIVQLAYAFQSNSKLFMVMEFVRGGDFFSLIRHYGLVQERDARLYVAQVRFVCSLPPPLPLPLLYPLLTHTTYTPRTHTHTPTHTNTNTHTHS